jgi:hypothetical protein
LLHATDDHGHGPAGMGKDKADIPETRKRAGEQQVRDGSCRILWNLGN